MRFALVYGNNVPSTMMRAVVQALQPCLHGLLTNAGMVVANAVYDTNYSNIDTVNNLIDPLRASRSSKV